MFSLKPSEACSYQLNVISKELLPFDSLTERRKAERSLIKSSQANNNNNNTVKGGYTLTHTFDRLYLLLSLRFLHFQAHPAQFSERNPSLRPSNGLRS
jgi:hypothetical protein